MRDDRTEPTDGDLVARFKGGDDEAFELLYRRHVESVRTVCAANTRDPDTREDAVQETFVRLLHTLPRFEGDLVAHWLRRTAKNLCIDEYRRARNSEVPLTAALSDGASVDDISDRVIARHSVGAVLEELRPVDAALLRAHHLDDQPLRTMALSWGSTEKSLAVRLVRARRAFAAVGTHLRGVLPLPLLWRSRSASSRSESLGYLGQAAVIGVVQLAIVGMAYLPEVPAEGSEIAPPTAVVERASSATAPRPRPARATAAKDVASGSARQAAERPDAVATPGVRRDAVLAVPGTDVRIDRRRPQSPGRALVLRYRRGLVDEEWKVSVHDGRARTAMDVACHGARSAPAVVSCERVGPND